MTEFKNIDSSGYKGLAKAHIDRYNRNVKDLARENRLGRGNESYAKDLASKELPRTQKVAVKEMVAQDSRAGRVTAAGNMGGAVTPSGGGGGGGGGGRSASS